MARNDEKKNIRCSFCGKHQDQVRRLIAGPGVYICNECVQLCMGILDDNYEPVDEPGSSGMPDVIPTPQEIHTVLDQYIIGQEQAKKVLPVAVHNHYKRVFYKGALDGKGAHSTWVGNALIQPTAPGTDSYELNRNLVLTPGAIADPEPNLEIENGNIIGAGHASSVGRFDDEELFYLESRGISENEARKLVVRGFFGELVEEIGIPAISEHLMNVIDKRLARGESDAIAQVLEEK